MDTAKKFSRLTVALHWLVAAGMISLICLGLYMVRTESWHLYDIHKSIGLLLFIAILARLAWRLRNGLPQPVRPMSRGEHLIATAAHCLLLVMTVVLPVTGMMYSGFSGHGFGIFNWEILPAHPDPAKPGEVTPIDAGWSDLGQALHGYLGYALLALVLLHAAAAFKHHWIDKDSTLKRMLGARSD